MFQIDRYLKERAALIEAELARRAALGDGRAGRLFEAMRYSLLGGGKRLRPILALAACESVGGRIEAAMGLACAIEMIHTYSMIHDDLPCMDDDDLRRGKPTNHKVYGEAIATLAGDGLLTDAFAVLCRSISSVPGLPPTAVLETLKELSEAAGSSGMVAGQVVDLTAGNQPTVLEDLEYLDSHKTGALFVASVRGGARLGGASASELAQLKDYAEAFGLAYQVVDDLLDIEASEEQMGKRTHKDAELGKATFPGLLGVAGARRFAHELLARAHHALAAFDDRADPLRHLATLAAERKL